ncbi:MAG: hypothetical protein ACLQVN_20460 [Bryobacteraceae bacterium]
MLQQKQEFPTEWTIYHPDDEPLKYAEEYDEAEAENRDAAGSEQGRMVVSLQHA